MGAQMKIYKKRFQDHIMQTQYEQLIKKGVHWHRAEQQTKKAHNQYWEDSECIVCGQHAKGPHFPNPRYKNTGRARKGHKEEI